MTTTTTIQITTTATTWAAAVRIGRQRKLHTVAMGPIANLTADDCRERAKNTMPCWWREYAPAIYAALSTTLGL